MPEVTTVVVGNLTDAPELRYTQNGIPVASFTIASTPRHFDKKTNDWKDGDTVYLRASVWRTFAENIAGSLQKGSRVIASGALRQKSYETREGEKRTTIELDVDELGASLKHATAVVTKASGGGQSAPAQDAAPAADPGWGAFGDDTPF